MSSFTMSCHKPEVFSVKIIIFCRTTHLLQDVNNITHKESTLKISKQTFHFQSYFYQFMKNSKTAKCFTLRTPHISTDLFFLLFSFYVNQPPKPSQCLIMTSCWVRINSAISKIYYMSVIQRLLIKLNM